jgi:signal transduction histidine kinase
MSDIRILGIDFNGIKADQKSIILYTILLNILIWLYFICQIDITNYQLDFYLQIVFSLIVNTLLSPLCIFFRKKQIFLLKYFFLFVILYPLSGYIYFNILINFEFILLVMLIFRHSLGLGASILAILFQVLYKPEHVLGNAGTGISVSDKLFTAGFLIVLTIILNSLKLLMIQRKRQRTEIKHDQEIISKLTEIALQSQVYATKAEEKSIQKERRRLTREIHDIVGYTLVNVSMMMEVCIDDYNKKNFDELIKQIEKVKSHVREGHEQVRYSLRALSMFYPEPLKGIAAYQKIIRTFRESTGITVNVDFTNIKFEYTREIDVFIIRLLQEGLINSYRHGRSTEINIHFFESESIDGTFLIIYIRDNGIGSDEITEGIGFRGMRERVLILNGEITFSNVIEGFQIRARIPLWSI